MAGTQLDPGRGGRMGSDWRSEMESRLARISQDVKSTQSDIAEVIFYLKKQPSALKRPYNDEQKDLPNKQPNSVFNEGHRMLSNGAPAVIGKDDFINCLLAMLVIHEQMNCL